MKIKFGPVTDTSAEFDLNGGGSHVITIHCGDVTEDAPVVARAINLFPALVSALLPFHSSEMGSLLVAMIDMREEGGKEAHKRLSHMISLIDVILEAAGVEEDDDDEPEE
jgi:hypothetical protein